MKKIFLKIILIIVLINTIALCVYPKEVQAANYNQVTINANSNNRNGIDAFPESYKKMLNKLVQETGHTNWKFKPFYTDIDWNELTSGNNENRCLRNTIYKTNGSWICSCGRQGDAGYYCACAKIVNYYLDPRNFLTETTIFQFLDLSNSTKVSVADIQKAVQGTYLAGSVNGKSYAQMIYDAAEASGESALSIVVKIFQELGRGTTLPGMINGKNATYPNTYNFFNYGASDGNGNIVRGFEYAKNAGWNTPEKALIEGAKLISNSYIKAGQNTKYTFKFDVVDDSATGLYWHQYMTNIQDPNNQAKMLYDEYLNNGWLNQDLTFVIPVYKNMPSYVKLPSSLTTNNGKLYYISSNYSDVSLRSSNNTSSSILESLKKDTVVLMQQYNVGNSGWSKVSVNGQTGYVYNKYLTEVNLTKDAYNVPSQPGNTNQTTLTPTPTPTPVKQEDKSKIVNSNVLVTPSYKLDALKKAYKITSVKGDNQAQLGTGTQLTIDNKNYTVVKLGDPSGDGVINSADLLKVVKHLKGTNKLATLNGLAADCNSDGNVNSADLLKIVKYLKGTGNIMF